MRAPPLLPLLISPVFSYAHTASGLPSLHRTAATMVHRPKAGDHRAAAGQRQRTGSCICADTDRYTVLVVGGGIGGVSVSYDLRHVLRKQDQVILLSDRSSFEFTPSNPWVATGFRKPQDIRVDLATTLPHHGVDFILGKAEVCNAMKREIITDGGDRIAYDYLVVATGPKLGVEAVPGVKEYGVSVCTTDHAIHANQEWETFLMREEPGSVVVGCLPGASCFGPAYEYVLLLDHELRTRKRRDQTTLTFLTAEPYIGHLGLASVGDSEKELVSLFEAKGIKFEYNVRITSVSESEVRYSRHGENEEQMVPAQFKMFIPPFNGQQVWKDVPDLSTPNGLVLVDEHMRSQAYDNIFAVGTAVQLAPVDDTPIPTGAPKTGYMIESMGTCAAAGIRAQIDAERAGRDVHQAARKAPSLSTLCITDFGDTGGVALAIPQFRPRNVDVHYMAPIVRLAKLSFEQYFLFKVRSGDCDPYYEKWMLKLIGVNRLVEDADAADVLKNNNHA